MTDFMTRNLLFIAGSLIADPRGSRVLVLTARHCISEGLKKGITVEEYTYLQNNNIDDQVSAIGLSWMVRNDAKEKERKEE